MKVLFTNKMRKAKDPTPPIPEPQAIAEAPVAPCTGEPANNDIALGNAKAWVVEGDVTLKLADRPKLTTLLKKYLLVDVPPLALKLQEMHKTGLPKSYTESKVYN